METFNIIVLFFKPDKSFENSTFYLLISLLQFLSTFCQKRFFKYTSIMPINSEKQMSLDQNCALEGDMYPGRKYFRDTKNSI